MKLIYIAKAHIPSRTANSVHVMKMCQAFADTGHEVELYVLSERKIQERDKSKVYQYYAVNNNFKIVYVSIINTKGSRLRYLFSSFILGLSLIRRLLFNSCDYVYGRDLLSCTVAATLGKKTYFESHAPVWRSQLEAKLFEIFIRLPCFSKLVVISDALRQIYLSRYDLLNDKNTLIAHDAANIPMKKQGVNPLLGGGEQLNVGYVGHLYEGKGVEIIANVAPRLPDVNFHIIGGLEKDIDYWKAEILAPNVFFYGYIQQNSLASYIHHIDVCLLPNQRHVSGFGANVSNAKNISDYTSPLKMFEYMAYKKPIIASDLPVLREVLSEDFAYLVPPDDIGSWVDAIEALKDKEKRGEFGNKGYLLFKENYTWKNRVNLVLSDTK